MLVISVKYIAVVMRADNQGEGGILALMALIPLARQAGGFGRPALILLGIFGAALLYGDGIITPAISVLGAVEGLAIATPVFERYVVTITVVILLGLFAVQQYGTDRVGRLFGPVMLVWFVVIGSLGVRWIVRSLPSCCRSIPVMPCDSSARTAGTASRCWAPSSLSSRAARRSMPTWGTSANVRSAWHGSGSCCRRCS